MMNNFNSSKVLFTFFTYGNNIFITSPTTITKTILTTNTIIMHGERRSRSTLFHFLVYSLHTTCDPHVDHGNLRPIQVIIRT